MKVFSRNIMLIASIFLFSGIAVGWYVHDYQDDDKAIPTITGQVRANLSQYKFINPPLFSDSVRSNRRQFNEFAGSMGSYVNAQKANGSIKSASVYFRDLNAAQWTGVDEDELYTPSSMLKVVAMMAALKLAETNPLVLSEKLHYVRPGADAPYDFKAVGTLTDGYYSLQSLIGFMIKDSDNGAFDAIISDPKINSAFVQTYSLFRLPQSALEGSTTDFMSPKSLSSVFRTLYNSSFFGWNLSEQVLSLLSQTTFNDGLVAGVPQGTVVAHKFGENTDELHDCGIIYHPGHPYLLCVMTRGGDIQSLESTIGHISKIAWDFVDNGGLTNSQ